MCGNAGMGDVGMIVAGSVAKWSALRRQGLAALGATRMPGSGCRRGLVQEDRAHRADVGGTLNCVRLRWVDGVGKDPDEAVALALSEVLRGDFGAVAGADASLGRDFDVHDPYSSLG